MAVTAQLNPAPVQRKDTHDKSDAIGTPIENTWSNSTDVTDGPASGGQSQVARPVDNNFASTDTNTGNGGGNQSAMTPYTAADFNDELRTAMNAFPFEAEDNGYFALFNPALRTPVLVYNPYRIQSEFDAFDIGDYVDM